MMGVSVTFRMFAIIDGFVIFLATVSENVQLQVVQAFFTLLTLIATAWIASRQAKTKAATDEVKAVADKVVKLTEEQTATIDKTHDAVNTNHQKDQDDLRELRQEIAALKEKVLNASVGEATYKQEVKSGKEASEKAVAVAEAAGRSGIGIAPPPHAAVHPAAPPAAAPDDVQKVEITNMPKGIEKPKR